MIGLVFNILLISFAFVEVSAIHCYDCNSFDDPRCGDPFDNSTTLMTVDCDTKRHPIDINIASTFCRKIKQRINGNFRVIRSCGYIEGNQDKDSCERHSLSNANEIRYCQCDDNLCNGSDITLKTFKMFTLASVIIASLVRKVF